MALRLEALARAGESGPSPDAFEPAFDYSAPAASACGVLFASPHSGRLYPAGMQAALAVPLDVLRRTEDAYVDELFGDVPALGAGLLAARYARSVVDLNRDQAELDAGMFADGLPRACGRPTPRVEAGLGCLPRVGAGGEAIYARALSRAEGEARLTHIYDAYHQHLHGALEDLRGRHGGAVLIDCHSMPSAQPGYRPLPDIVLGDRFGTSCDGRLTNRAERAFRDAGFSVARNAPYAGGFITRRYGVPRRDVHALQIEVKRALYMNEATLERLPGFDTVRARLAQVAAALISASALILDHSF